MLTATYLGWGLEDCGQQKNKVGVVAKQPSAGHRWASAARPLKSALAQRRLSCLSNNPAASMTFSDASIDPWHCRACRYNVTAREGGRKRVDDNATPTIEGLPRSLDVGENCLQCLIHMPAPTSARTADTRLDNSKGVSQNKAERVSSCGVHNTQRIICTKVLRRGKEMVLRERWTELMQSKLRRR